MPWPIERIGSLPRPSWPKATSSKQALWGKTNWLVNRATSVYWKRIVQKRDYFFLFAILGSLGCGGRTELDGLNLNVGGLPSVGGTVATGGSPSTGGSTIT